MGPSELANLTRWNGQAKFYEVYFVEVQDREQKIGLWIRYTLKVPAGKPKEGVAELWAMFYDRRDPKKSHALKKTVPLETAQIGRDRFFFEVAGARIDQSGCRGELEEGARKISWDLRFGEGTLAKLYPERMYRAPFPRTKFLSPHFDLRASGTISGQRDESWSLNDEAGLQSHLWGTKHAKRHRWAHANTFKEDPSAVFQGISAQVMVGPLTTPLMTGYLLQYRGELYRFNSMLEILRTNESRGDPSTHSEHFPVGRWIVGGGNAKLRFRGELWDDPSHYLGVRYTDPDGSGLVCNHSKLAHTRLEILLPDGSGNWRVAETLNSDSTALEFVGRAADPRVPVLI